ncbi:hypothetical protein [Gramella sp. KN1008]|nr:hypothetical protein [Gramella sp. KN1008]
MNTLKNENQKCCKEIKSNNKARAKRIARFLIPRANENWLLYK